MCRKQFLQIATVTCDLALRTVNLAVVCLFYNKSIRDVRDRELALLLQRKTGKFLELLSRHEGILASGRLRDPHAHQRLDYQRLHTANAIAVTSSPPLTTHPHRPRQWTRPPAGDRMSPSFNPLSTRRHPWFRFCLVHIRLVMLHSLDGV
jgi:hypothetical protein